MKRSKTETWANIVCAALVVAAGIAWAAGVIGWGGFVAVFALSGGSIIVTHLDARRRREGSQS